MARARGNGEGSIYHRASDDRWVGAVSVGWDPSGKRIRKVVSAKSAEKCRSKLRELQRKIDDGLPIDDGMLTVNELLDRWLDVLRRQVAAPALANYEVIARYHLRPELGRRKLASLTVSQIDQLLAAKLDAGLSISTVRRIRSVLAQAITQAERWGLASRNIAKLSAPPKASRQEGRALSIDEAKDLIAHLQGHRRQTLFVTMLTTGLRRGEALGLKWEDVDPDQGKLLVRRQLRRDVGAFDTATKRHAGGSLILVEPKTSSSRRAVDLPSIAVDMLALQRERQQWDRQVAKETWQESGHVFTTSIGTPLDPRNISREFATLAEQAGLGHWHIHELRHSAASLMLGGGVPIEVVSNVLGHASIRITADTYGHIGSAQRRAAARALNSVFGTDAP